MLLYHGGTPFKCHEEVWSLQPMIPPKRLTFSPLTGGCSEGLDAFRFFFQDKKKEKEKTKSLLRSCGYLKLSDYAVISTLMTTCLTPRTDSIPLRSMPLNFHYPRQIIIQRMHMVPTLFWNANYNSVETPRPLKSRVMLRHRVRLWEL